MVSRSLGNLACGVALFTTAVSVAYAAEPASAQKEIMRLEKDYNDAYAANDLPKYFAYYADDAGLIFYNKRTTLADYRKEWTQSVRTEPIESVKLADVVIRVSPTGDTAIASYQIDVRTRHPASKSTDEHAFETDVWLKHAGRWQIAHVHYSTKADK
ncbi:MAG: YybH family protein [Steroidobacteraceae bacterium]